VVHGAPCCTPHSLPTGWMAEGDPRGEGYFPCAWGFATPARPPAGAADGTCDQLAAAGGAVVGEAPGAAAAAGAGAGAAGAAEAGAGAEAAGAVLMCCVMPEAGSAEGGEADAEGVRFLEAAVLAGVPAARIEMLAPHASPPSAALAAAASRLGARLVTMRPAAARAAGASSALSSSSSSSAASSASASAAASATSSGWAAAAASCVEHAAAVVQRGRAVVLSTAQV